MTNYSKMMECAENICVKNGGRLTHKRKLLLSVLLHADRAMSAYQISDAYHQTYGQTIPAMSVYRILDFLVEHHLVHKLSSKNKYVACSEMQSKHEHHVAQFLVCDSCHRVEEIELDGALGQQVVFGALQSGFQPMQPQLEISGLCRDCNK